MSEYFSLQSVNNLTEGPPGLENSKMVVLHQPKYAGPCLQGGSASVDKRMSSSVVLGGLASVSCAVNTDASTLVGVNGDEVSSTPLVTSGYSTKFSSLHSENSPAVVPPCHGNSKKVVLHQPEYAGPCVQGGLNHVSADNKGASSSVVLGGLVSSTPHVATGYSTGLSDNSLVDGPPGLVNPKMLF